jgi:hypothetical protein
MKKDNTNAKQEFLSITKDFNVIAAKISFDGSFGENSNSFDLKPLYLQEEYEKFLKFLDREYYSGYGGQELYGVIFCENGVWMDRGEYDGSEWWNIHQYPSLSAYFGEKLALKYERNKKLKRIEDNF